MAALMIVLFIGSWLPYCLVAMFGIVGLGQLVTPYSAELPVMLAKASAIWNPIVYALKHPRYRSALAGYLPKVVVEWCHLGTELSIKSSSTRKTYDTQKPATTAPPAAAAAAAAAGVALHEAAAGVDDIEIGRQIPAVAVTGDVEHVGITHM